MSTRREFLMSTTVGAAACALSAGARQAGAEVKYVQIVKRCAPSSAAAFEAVARAKNLVGSPTVCVQSAGSAEDAAIISLAFENGARAEIILSEHCALPEGMTLRQRDVSHYVAA